MYLYVRVLVFGCAQKPVTFCVIPFTFCQRLYLFLTGPWVITTLSAAPPVSPPVPDVYTGLEFDNLKADDLGKVVYHYIFAAGGLMRTFLL